MRAITLVVASVGSLFLAPITVEAAPDLDPAEIAKEVFGNTLERDGSNFHQRTYYDDQGKFTLQVVFENGYVGTMAGMVTIEDGHWCATTITSSLGAVNWKDCYRLTRDREALHFVNLADDSSVYRATIVDGDKYDLTTSTQVWRSFIEESGATQSPPFRELVANPFLYENKVVVYYARFEQMIAADRAMFNPVNGDFSTHFIVNGVPPEALRVPGRVVVAGKVTGNSPMTVLGTQVMLPVLDFSRIHVCATEKCDEFFGAQ